MEIQRRVPWNLIAIWLLVSTIAVLSCSLNYPSARLNDEYLPLGNDAFYHGRRILDTVHDPKSFYEFDTKIHAPEGSLLTWPWGYDYAMASIVRFGMWLGISDNPVLILLWIPVAAVLISLALLIAIARLLQLSNTVTVLTGLCMALAPTTQLLHGFGQIDHHYAELIFILGALAGGLAWLHQPEKAWFAAAPAIALGMAPMVQNGLFILQLPLLAAVFILWLQNKALPVKTSAVFAAVLLATTTLILLPSLPFRTGRFEFYTLSWFHLYIAGCTAITMALMSRLKATRTGIITLLVISCALLIPIGYEMPVAQTFIAGTTEYLQTIGEMQPPLRFAQIYGVGVMSNFYSYLIWIMPLTALVCVAMGWRERNSPRLLFWIASVMGLALLSSQLRMHYFGGFALYLPWLILLEKFRSRHPEYQKKPVLLASMALVLLYFPSLRHQLVMPMPLASDLSFKDTRPMLAALSKACAEDPGIVLADTDVSHFIRYYTDCSVIANNFLLTPQHLAKATEVRRLFSLTPNELQAQAPLIKYVLIRPYRMQQQADGTVNYTFFSPLKPRLGNALLLGPTESIPPEFQLLEEARFPELDNMPYAKLYKIRRGAPSLATPSSNDVSE